MNDLTEFGILKNAKHNVTLQENVLEDNEVPESIQELFH